MVKNPPANEGHGFDPRSGKQHAMEQLSLWTATAWARALEPSRHNYWAHTTTTEAHTTRACAPQQEEATQ